MRRWQGHGTMGHLPFAIQAILVITSLATIGILGTTLHEIWRQADWLPLLLFAAVIGGELLRVDMVPKANGQRITFTLGIMGRFFILSVLGPAWAVAVTAIHTVITLARSRSAWYKTLYNLGVTVVTMYGVSHLLAWTWRVAPTLGLRAIPIILLVALYVAVTNSSVALAVALSAKQGFVAFWREHLAWSSLQELTLALTGLALGRAVDQLGWAALLLGSPLILLWATYRIHVRSQAEHTEELKRFADQLITTLAAMVDARDAFTFGHSTHVSRYALAMGRELGRTEAQLEELRVGALLHDIGKVGIPEHVLFKPGRLEPWEYELMKEHATIGHRIVSRIDGLQHAAEVIHQHHEWYNGRGYPRALAGECILLDARIVGVADTLEAIISDRPYRKGRTVDEALTEIKRGAGTQFDPHVVAALERVVEKEDPQFFVNSAQEVRSEPQTGSLAASGGRVAMAAPAIITSLQQAASSRAPNK